MESRFVLLLRKSFRRYRCDAAIDAAGFGTAISAFANLSWLGGNL